MAGSEDDERNGGGGLTKRQDRRVPLEASGSADEVGAVSGTFPNAAHRVALGADLEHPPAASRRDVSSKVGRPSKAAPFAERVRLWLAGEPQLSTQHLLQRAKEHDFLGSKTAFYALVASLRTRHSVPRSIIEGLPGEISQHDFGHVDLNFTDGSKRRCIFFASRLEYSRYTAVSLVEDVHVETLVRCLARDFIKFGGLPLLAVFDRPRSIVDTWGKSGEAAWLNAAFAQAIVDLGVGVELCAPRSRKRKQDPERIARWVKESFFDHGPFRDLTELQLRLEAWHIDVNQRSPAQSTGEIPETRRQQELARLRPIKVVPEELALRIPIVVSPTGGVRFEGVEYAMPAEAVHLAGTLFLYERRLRIVAGAFDVRHERRTKARGVAALP